MTPPLQYSCLENSMNRRVWWATGHRVTTETSKCGIYTCHSEQWWVLAITPRAFPSFPLMWTCLLPTERKYYPNSRESLPCLVFLYLVTCPESCFFVSLVFLLSLPKKAQLYPDEEHGYSVGSYAEHASVTFFAVLTLNIRSLDIWVLVAISQASSAPKWPE